VSEVGSQELRKVSQSTPTNLYDIPVNQLLSE
jgi:hypothetical protein